MKPQAEDHEALIRALEDKGWFWDGDFIYAPHRTMWLFGADPWQGEVEDFRERMSDRVHRLIRNKAYHNDPQQYQRCVEDAESLVTAAGELLKAKRDI
ncbi:MAG TPA: hypothetical protein VFD58_29420 [Blastocatellia bacterium]|nr:hypothetical protein [Blastocatellia bacterium]